jgi:hypothetical protein
MSESLIDEDMEIIKDSKPLKFGRDFARYGFVGVIFTFINIVLMWLFIDVLKAGTIIGASLTVIFIFFTKYYAYIVTSARNAILRIPIPRNSAGIVAPRSVRSTAILLS